METPLEGNKFIGELQKARKAGDSEFVVDGKTYQVEGSAIKMVDQMNPSLVQAVDPMSGMPQPNQINPSMVNPQALGSIQNRIPNVSGNQIPGSFNRVMPVAPLNKLGGKTKHGYLGSIKKYNSHIISQQHHTDPEAQRSEQDPTNPKNPAYKKLKKN